MPDLPTGTVTFLFTDIEGSTRLWQQHSETMRAALARHDALLRQAIEAHGGHVFKTVGDAFYAVFATASEAMEASVAAQRALQSQMLLLRVRMALHTGEAELRDADYFGPPLNHVARLLAAGHGGQVLLSQAAAEQLRSSGHQELSLRCLGEHRLRDLPCREVIFQLMPRGLPSEFPPLNTLDVAFRRGVVRATAISAVVIVLLGALALIAVSQARRADRQRQVAQDRQRMLRRSLYVAEMNLAQQAWEAGNLKRAVQLLDAQRPAKGQEDLRGFEWRYLWRLCQGDSLRTFRGHTDRVGAVAFSPDGTRLATASDDTTLRLWDVSGKRPPVVLRGQSQKLSALAWSPDGRLLATGSGAWDENTPGEVKLWGINTRRVVASLAGYRQPVDSVTFSPDGSLLAAGGVDTINTVRVWSVAARREVARLKGGLGGIGSVAFAPDGRRLAAINGSGVGPIRIWDVRGWREIASLGPQTGGGPCLAFSPDGRLLAAADWNSRVQLWDLARKRVVATLRSQGDIWCLAFAPDGRSLATGGTDGTVRLWDIPSALTHPVVTPRTTLRGHTDVVWSVAFSPDGQRLASASSDGTVQLWRPSPPPSRPLPAAGQEQATIWARLLSPDGRILAVGNADGTVDLWNTATHGRLGKLKQGPGETFGLAFSRNGKSLAVVTGLPERPPIYQTIKLWDVAAKRPLATLPKLPAGITGIALSPDGRTLAMGGRDKMVRLWDVAARREVALLKGHTASEFALAFSPDGRYLATTGGPDQIVRLWNLGPPGKGETGRVVRQTAILRGHKGWLSDLAFSPDSRTLATTCLDRTIRLWDVATGTEQAILEGHASQTQGIAFSPDGKTLASSSHDGAVKLWNLTTHQEVVTLRGHTDVVPTLAFSPDGNLLTTSSLDTPLQQWRAATFTETDAPAAAGPISR